MNITLRTSALGTALMMALGAPAGAGPQGPTVVGGSASVSNPGTGSVTINQQSNSAIINWQTFNIGTGEQVQVNQPSAAAVLLNRVVGGYGPSFIDGILNADGKVFIINRDGILFGRNAVVNTAGFLATTHDIANSDFMVGRYNFNIPGRADASIVNLGTITAANGGFAALVAPGVRNSGTITATLGRVGLAAANGFTLDFYGDQLLTLKVGDEIAASVKDVATGQPLNSLVSNDGKISANGGRVEITAAAARQVVDAVINNQGVIEANTIGTRKGMIVLGAATEKTKPSGAPVQTVKLGGQISAKGTRSGEKGGGVVVTGENIEVAGARIDASGQAGGGAVLIGGDWGGGSPDTGLVSNKSARLEAHAVPTASTVTIDAATVIDASAIARGDGGKVVVWSDKVTTFHGLILAKGGEASGDGGFAEVSGKRLNFAGLVDLRAAQGANGTLLLDPENYYVNGTGTPPILDPTASAISGGTLVSQLSLGNVVISTSSSGPNAGNIYVDSGIYWYGGGGLTLKAHNDVVIGTGATIQNIAGPGNLVLRADADGNGAGTVSFMPGSSVNYAYSSGSVTIFYNPLNYATPTNFTPNVIAGPGQLTAYMLVNNATDLANVSTNLGGTYAVGHDFNVAPGFVPIGPSPFTGVLNGLDFTIGGVPQPSTGLGIFAAVTGSIFDLNVRYTNNLGPSLLQYVTHNQWDGLDGLPKTELLIPWLALAPPDLSRPRFGPRVTRERWRSGMPPLGETRFIPDQVVVRIDSSLPEDRLDALLRRFGLSIISSTDLPLIGQRMLQLRIGGGRNVRDVISTLEAAGVTAVQPNYLFTLAEQASAVTGPVQQESTQYVIGKLHLSETHRLAKGANILVAVIDSKIDAAHPDLDGVVLASYEADNGAEPAHSHGTGMAGAIASRRRLLGTAPAARLLAAHAFSTRAQSGAGTTLQILKSIDWAVSQGARVINMSFAGPRDPALERAIKSAHERDIVLVAAAGNAGPKSPPLYPGADPHVIAVTATDIEDKVFTNANRGNYIAVAAPGVDIIVPAPDGAYQTTTGTSVATAHVSGIVALMLERNPALTPADVRQILMSSARRLGTGPRDPDFGAGLVDAYKATVSVPLTQRAPDSRAR